jgi:hypothetical protein
MKTIKLAGICLLIATSFLILTGFTWNPAQPQTVLKVTPQTLKVKVGERTTVDLAVEQVSELYGAEVHVKFDPDVLQVVDTDPAQEGVQIEPGTLPIPDFVVQNTADNQVGTIDYASTQLPPNKPGKGNGVVARITFQAKKVAVTSIQFDQFLLADTMGGSIQAVPQHGQVRVLGTPVWIFGVAAGLVVLGMGGGIGLVLMRGK